MYVYLPIAELSVNVFVIIGLGWLTGVLSGLFGVGGGFLLTPLLMFIGVPPSVAVSTAANQIIASSVSGFWSHWKRQNVDFKMGTYLLLGGLIGSTVGVAIFKWLQRIGYIDLVISASYVIFLGSTGAMMAGESLHSIMKTAKKASIAITQPAYWSKLPFIIEFPKSKLHMSALLPIMIGFFVGIMVSLMGIGGGFVLIPAMIYILGMPTSVVIGTSLFQIIFISANVTLLQAMTTQTVDVLLALLLLCGSVAGAQWGGRMGAKMPAEYLRGLLAMIVLLIATNLAFELFTPPDNIYTVDVIHE